MRDKQSCDKKSCDKKSCDKKSCDKKSCDKKSHKLFDINCYETLSRNVIRLGQSGLLNNMSLTHFIKKNTIKTHVRSLSLTQHAGS